MTNHLDEKWSAGTDFTISSTDGLPASGGIPDPIIGCVATEGCLGATPSSGVTWTISERLTGMGVFRPRDITNFNVSYTKGKTTTSEAFLVSNHLDLLDLWMLDTFARLNFQSDNTGGKSTDLSPTARVSYKVRNNLTANGELGLDWSKSSSSVLQNSSSTVREYFSLGFQYIF